MSKHFPNRLILSSNPRSFKLTTLAFILSIKFTISPPASTSSHLCPESIITDATQIILSCNKSLAPSAATSIYFFSSLIGPSSSLSVRFILPSPLSEIQIIWLDGIILMSFHRLQAEEGAPKRRVLQERSEERRGEERSCRNKRRSVPKITRSSGLFPGLLTSYSTKFIRKASQKSKSPLLDSNLLKKKSQEKLPRGKRKSLTANPNSENQEQGQRNTRYSSPPKNQVASSVLLSSSLQDEIKRIKTLSRFMLDMKLPSALPSRPRKEKRVFNLGGEGEQGKPLIEVRMERTNGFLRPVMLVRDPIQQQIQEKQLIEKRVKSVIRSKDKQKLKTAPELVEFGLHIKSHQDVFDQQTRFRETKNELIKRFRSTWTRKLSKSSKKMPETEVSPWIVPEVELD